MTLVCKCRLHVESVFMLWFCNIYRCAAFLSMLTANTFIGAAVPQGIKVSSSCPGTNECKRPSTSFLKLIQGSDRPL